MDNERRAALGGYAPGNYMCRCAICEGEFTGDKRAFQCWPCAKKASDRAALVEGLAKAIAEAEGWAWDRTEDMHKQDYRNVAAYVLPAAIDLIRSETLEEAAKVCDAQFGFNEYHHQCAAAIRALKGGA